MHLNQQTEAVSEMLESELNLEAESLNSELPKMFNEYLKKYQFNIVETPGKNEAQIRKVTEDGEIVDIFFDVSQVTTLPYDKQDADNVLGESGEGAKTDVASDRFDPGDEVMEEFNQFTSGQENFANVSVVISKKDTTEGQNGALAFELLMNLEDNSFFVENVTTFKSIEDLLSDSADTQFKRELQYKGPPFSNLDEELQETLEIYLESRGVNEELATFITVYSEFKENNEYISWLKQMKNFFNWFYVLLSTLWTIPTTCLVYI